MEYEYSITRSFTIEDDFARMRTSKETIKKCFGDKIVKIKEHSRIQLEDAGIGIILDQFDTNTIKINFKVFENDPQARDWDTYADLALNAKQSLMDENKNQAVTCRLTFAL